MSRTLDRYLSKLGYGTRREVAYLFAQQRVTDAEGAALEPEAPTSHENTRVDGAPLDPPPGALILLHKPVGYVCSTTDASPVVYELLPPRFRDRDPIMAPIGRLDRDTSGMLLITDDGPLNHRIASPKRHLPKRYIAELASDLRGDEAVAFASGTLMLERETEPLRPASLEVLGPRRARLTITEGRYHQVRRMFAAVGNHVVALHRDAIGSLALGDLAPGAWRILSNDERPLVTPP